MNTMTNWLKTAGLGLTLLTGAGLDASNALLCDALSKEPDAPVFFVTKPIDPGADSTLTILSGFFLSAQDDPHCFTILGIERYPQNRLVIFDGTGQEVWSCENYRNHWCGPARPGMYYYVLTLPDGSTLSGTLRISD